MYHRPLGFARCRDDVCSVKHLITSRAKLEFVLPLPARTDAEGPCARVMSLETSNELATALLFLVHLSHKRVCYLNIRVVIPWRGLLSLGERIIVRAQLDVERPAALPAARRVTATRGFGERSGDINVLPESRPKVVITHDFMETYGGAERVTAEMAVAFPEAPVVAILGRRDVAQRMGVADRFRSLLPERRALLRYYRYLTPVLGAYTDDVRIEEADVVLSSSYAFAHRLRSRNDAARVCYCHSAVRFAWSMTGSYKGRYAGTNAVAGCAFEGLAAMLRRSDRRSAQPIQQYLTQSPFTARQLAEFYGREAAVIGAPIDCGLFSPSPEPPDDYYLFCGRLIEPYKRVRIAIEAFRRTGQRLVVAGGGPDFERLSAEAPPNVEFLGHIADDQLVPLMQHCEALVFPSCDDFGLIPLEVMACGRPVLAYADGGSLYTSKPGTTGELFFEQTADSIEAALRSFDPGAYEPAKIREHALQWDSGRFRELLVKYVVAAACSPTPDTTTRGLIAA